MKKISAALAVLIALPPAVCRGYDENFKEITTHEEMQEFYQKNQDIKKKEDKYKKDREKRRRIREQNPQLDEREAEEEGLKAVGAIPEGQDPAGLAESQANADQLASESEESFLADLIAEYKVEKGQIVEDNIWTAAENKADGSTRRLYRDWLRNMYWCGHAAGDDTGSFLAYVRKCLETQDGWTVFPTEDMGPVPPEAAAIYTGGHVRMGPGVLAMAVHEHEWLHWWDDMNGSMDGQRGHASQVEPYAYANMGRVGICTP